MNASKVLPASKSAREHVRSICHAMTRPARLGKVAGRFFRELERALPESVTSNPYRSWPPSASCTSSIRILTEGTEIGATMCRYPSRSCNASPSSCAPAWHARHHPKGTAGHGDHAVLNGWSDWLLRPLKFDPALLGGLQRISDWARSVDAPQSLFPRRLIESLRRLRPDVLDNNALWHLREIMCESGWGDVTQAKFVHDALMQAAASLGIDPGAVQRELQALSKNIKRGALEELPPVLGRLGVVLVEPSLGRRPMPLFPQAAGARAA